MSKLYLVRLVEMDEAFNNSINDLDCFGYTTLVKAKKIYTEWLKEYTKNPPETNCYLCIELFYDYGDGYIEWQDQIMYKEIVNHSTERV